MASVDVVIVNWNSGDQLQQCIESLIAHDRAQVKGLIVVDNDSSDGSADFCESEPNVRLVRTGRNLGFGAACNIGAAMGDAPFILLLNPDTRLISPVLGQVSEFLQSPAGDGYGIAGVMLVDEDERVTRHCARFPTAMTFIATSLALTRALPKLFPPIHLEEFDHLESRPVDHVMGAFYMIRRPLYEKLKGFDERFFVYLEDVDLSYRAHLQGSGCHYLADQRVFHRGGGTTAGVKMQSILYALEARMTYSRKHFSTVGHWALMAVTLFADPLTRAADYLMKGSLADVRASFRAHRLLWKRLGRTQLPGSPRGADDAR